MMGCTTTLYLLGTLVTILITCVYLFYKHKYSYWKKLGVPYEKPKFIVGTLHESLFLKTTLGEDVAKMYTKYKAKGFKYIGGYMFHMPFLLIIDPELIKNVFAKDFDHFVDRGAYIDEENDPLSAHLFSLEGLKWKHLRQKLTPTFTSGKLKMMFQTLVDCTKDLENCLDGYVAKDEPIDIKKILANYTTDVIGSCAFGIDCNSFQNPDSDFIRLAKKGFEPKGLDRFKMFFAILFPDVAKFLKMKITNHEADVFFRNLVKETIEYREKNNVKRNDFMELLIQLKNKGEVEHYDEDEEEIDKSETVGTTLTVLEATAQAFIFFIAGYETSSTTMAFCLYELAKNPEIQEKARRDIINNLKKHDGKITYQSVQDMRYLERVIQETLRLHPPVMVLQRIVTKEYTIPDTDITLKNKLACFVSALALHMDPEYWPEPEKFEPDRFTEENKATRPDFTYLPFGDGPRICIGLRFGMMQTKVGICKLLYNYKFSINPKMTEPIALDPRNFIHSAKGGIWLNAQKVTT